MTVTRWEPFRQMWTDMNRLYGAMNQLFERGARRQELAATYPPINLWEDENFVYAEAELPGLKLDDLEIYVTGGNQLALKGTRQPSERGQGVWHRQERAFGTFTRVLTLPTVVDADKVEARFEHGVLTVKLAKSEAAKPRRITVKAE